MKDTANNATNWSAPERTIRNLHEELGICDAEAMHCSRLASDALIIAGYRAAEQTPDGADSLQVAESDRINAVIEVLDNDAEETCGGTPSPEMVAYTLNANRIYGKRRAGHLALQIGASGYVAGKSAADVINEVGDAVYTTVAKLEPMLSDIIDADAEQAEAVEQEVF